MQARYYGAGPAVTQVPTDEIITGQIGRSSSLANGRPWHVTLSKKVAKSTTYFVLGEKYRHEVGLLEPEEC